MLSRIAKKLAYVIVEDVVSPVVEARLEARNEAWSRAIGVLALTGYSAVTAFLVGRDSGKRIERQTVEQADADDEDHAQRHEMFEGLKGLSQSVESLFGALKDERKNNASAFEQINAVLKRIDADLKCIRSDQRSQES